MPIFQFVQVYISILVSFTLCLYILLRVTRSEGRLLSRKEQIWSLGEVGQFLCGTVLGRGEAMTNLLFIEITILHPYCPSRTLRSLETSLLKVPRFSLETFGKKNLLCFWTHCLELPITIPLKNTASYNCSKENLRPNYFTFICAEVCASFCMYH